MRIAARALLCTISAVRLWASVNACDLGPNARATWCGPCMDELPHAQKLYEKTNDRHDILVLTMNADEELGLVELLVREKGCTFPVLPAYGFVNKLLDSVAIPSAWIFDRRGKWHGR
jgi:thiol-disulfide isomerase/thioredoxin